MIYLGVTITAATVAQITLRNIKLNKQKLVPFNSSLDLPNNSWELSKLKQVPFNSNWEMSKRNQDPWIRSSTKKKNIVIFTNNISSRRSSNGKNTWDNIVRHTMSKRQSTMQSDQRDWQPKLSWSNQKTSFAPQLNHRLAIFSHYTQDLQPW